MAFCGTSDPVPSFATPCASDLPTTFNATIVSANTTAPPSPCSSPPPHFSLMNEPFALEIDRRFIVKCICFLFVRVGDHAGDSCGRVTYGNSLTFLIAVRCRCAQTYAQHQTPHSAGTACLTHSARYVHTLRVAGSAHAHMGIMTRAHFTLIMYMLGRNRLLSSVLAIWYTAVAATASAPNAWSASGISFCVTTVEKERGGQRGQYGDVRASSVVGHGFLPSTDSLVGVWVRAAVCGN